MHINQGIAHGNQMNRGYIILLAGTGSFIIGIIIFLIFAELRGATDPLLMGGMVEVNQTVGPYESVQISGHGTNTQSNFSLIISSEPSDVILRAQIKDPKDKTISINEFRDQFFDSFKPESAGDYVTIISNKGAKPATVEAMLSQIPVFAENDENQLSLLYGILVGMILAIIGILLLVGGGVILIIDKRKFKRQHQRAEDN
jgi:hypothetical protein